MVLLLHICTKYHNSKCTFTYTTSNDPKYKLSDCISQGIQFSFLCKGRNFHHLYRSLHYTELFCFSSPTLNTHLHPHQLFEHFQLSQLTGFKELAGKHLRNTLINTWFLFVGVLLQIRLASIQSEFRVKIQPHEHLCGQQSKMPIFL